MRISGEYTFIILLSFLFANEAYAQNPSALYQLPATRDLLKVTAILNPGISYEKRVARTQTIFVHGYMATTAQLGWSSSMGTSSRIYFDPAFSVAYRYYYNLERRESKGRSVAYNNGNYFSLISDHIITKSRLDASYYIESSRRLVNTLGLVYGFQRNYRSRLSLDFHAGLGYRYGKSSWQDGAGNIVRNNEGDIRVLADISLGFWLGRRDL